MRGEFAGMGATEFAAESVLRFVRTRTFAVVAVSVLVPCYWHSHIQAGDLGSHVYNAWLAQLVERQQVTGLVVVPQWNNVLFDVLVVHAANALGFVAAERLVVSFAVLVFFWGSFSFLAAVCGRPPWFATPFLFVLAYGYAFEMGFMNYYLSVGLAFVALGAAWKGGAGNWLLAIAVGGVALLAHPIGFVLFAGTALYIGMVRWLPGWIRGVVLVVVVAAFVLLRLYFRAHEDLAASWRVESLLQIFGQDQMNVYGRRYEVLSWFALAWGVAVVAGAVYDWVFRVAKPSRALRVALELYTVTVIGTICLPENFRSSLYAGWVGLLVSRLTLVTAVFGLLALAALPLPSWTWRGAAVIAAVFAVFLYQDTGKLDRLERNARAMIQTLPSGTRIVAVANAPEYWRIPFIYHSIDRACIGRCFSYANYEASSLQFRVRAQAGNSVVTTSVDQSDDMSSGDYVVRRRDLPLVSIYQCDEQDWTELCARELRAGQKTEDPEAEPGPVPEDEE